MMQMNSVLGETLETSTGSRIVNDLRDSRQLEKVQDCRHFHQLFRQLRLASSSWRRDVVNEDLGHTNILLGNKKQVRRRTGAHPPAVQPSAAQERRESARRARRRQSAPRCRGTRSCGRTSTRSAALLLASPPSRCGGSGEVFYRRWRGRYVIRSQCGMRCKRWCGVDCLWRCRNVFHVKNGIH